MRHSSSLPGRTSWLNRSASLMYICGMLAIALLLITAPGFNIASAANQAAVPNVKLSARSLFQGWFKYGDWLPLEISLENYGEATTVQVEATIVTRISGSNYNTTYQREVNLSERANKRFFLYVIPYVETTNPSGSIVYDTSVILKAGGRKLGEEKVNLLPVSPTNYMVGVVTQDPSALTTSLSNLKINGRNSRVSSVSMPLSDIPDQANGLRSFNALILGEVNTETLSVEQRTALRDWVEAGGQLILLGGNGWGRVKSAFSTALLPLDISNYANISSLDGLVTPNGDELKGGGALPRPAVMARGQVLQGARLLSYLPDGSNSLAVSAERRLGAGRMVGLTLDLAVPPMIDWSGASQIWQELFTFNLTPFNTLYQENNPQVKNAQDMLSFISSVPELRLPDIMPYFLILLLYLVLIGPLNYLVLKKLGRLELAWFTLPALGIVFALVTLNYANSQPPGDVLISQITVVQTGVDQETAQVRSYAAVFSPSERTYDISQANPVVPGDNLTRTLITPLNRPTSSVTDNEPARVMVQGERPHLDDFQIGQWSAQGFALETTAPSRAFQVVSNLHYDNNKIVGTIRNNTGSPLKNTVLIMSDQMVRFRDVIEAGEVINVDFDLPIPTAAVMSFCTTNIASSSFTSQSPAEKLNNLLLQDRRDDKLLQVRASFLKKLYESGRYSPLNNQRGLDLIGWMDQNPLPLTVGGVTSQSKSSQVLIARLPVDFETNSGDGRFLIPAMGVWPQSATTNNGNTPFTNRTDRTDQLCLARGNVTVQFLLPIERGTLKIKTMTLYLNSFTAAGRREPTLPDLVEIYDYQARSWQSWVGLNNSALSGNTGSPFSNPPAPVKNVLEDAARFADPQTGRILLRMSYNSANSVLFIQHELEIEGTRN